MTESDYPLPAHEQLNHAICCSTSVSLSSCFACSRRSCRLPWPSTLHFSCARACKGGSPPTCSVEEEDIAEPARKPDELGRNSPKVDGGSTPARRSPSPRPPEPLDAPPVLVQRPELAVEVAAPAALAADSKPASSGALSPVAAPASAATTPAPTASEPSADPAVPASAPGPTAAPVAAEPSSLSQRLALGVAGLRQTIAAKNWGQSVEEWKSGAQKISAKVKSIGYSVAKGASRLTRAALPHRLSVEESEDYVGLLGSICDHVQLFGASRSCAAPCDKTDWHMCRATTEAQS
jgi:hypothetical protein